MNRIKSCKVTASKWLMFVSVSLIIPWISSNTVAEPGVFEEVVVTAQKREQSIRDVGMSVSAATGSKLKELGINDTSDLSKLDNSFSFSRSIYGTPIYTIRGVGFNDVSLAAPPTVSAYSDEVPYSFSSLAKGASLDVQRVEILRGPQGTLFGQNATGGAVNYIAAKPTDTFNAGFSSSVASFSAIDIEGYVSGPMSESLRARLAAKVRQGGAWQQAYTRSDEHGDRDEFIGRLLLDWTPSDTLSMLINLNTWRDKSETQVSQLVDVFPLNPEFSAGVPELFEVPPAPTNARAAEWDPDTDFRADQKFYQASVRTEYDFSDSVTLTSITSYLNYTQSDLRDLDGQPLQTLGIIANGEVKSFSQELRAGGMLFDDKVNWLLGVNYATDDVVDDIAFLVSDSPSSFSFVGFGFDRYEVGGPIAEQTTKTGAVFGNIEWLIYETLSVHAGARYTDSKTDFEGCTIARDEQLAGGLTAVQNFIKGGVGVVPVEVGDCFTLDETLTPGLFKSALNEDNISGRVGLNWTPAEATLFYATVSKGYKAGSFPGTLVATETVQLMPVTQESVLAYELGFKIELLDRTLQLDSAFFHYDYKDKQLRGRIIDPLALFGNLEVLVNVPDSEVDGAELSGQWLAAEGLTVSFSTTYLDTHVTGDFINFDAFGNIINFNGEPFPYAPQWAASTGLEYRWSINDGMVAIVGVNLNYRDDTISGFGTEKAIDNGFPSQRIDDYSLLDLRAGIESADGNWQIMVWGRNVTDEYYWLDAQRNIDTVSRSAGMPATYGFSLNYSIF